MKKVKSLILDHLKKYPLSQPQDLFKFAYQSAFGCEHMISSEENLCRRIKEEYSSMNDVQNEAVVSLGDSFCRLPLSYLRHGLSPETLSKLFYLSSQKKGGGKEALSNIIFAINELSLEGKLPFDREYLRDELCKWESDGYPAIHHSEVFRDEYSPAYRVISKEYLPFLPLFENIDKRLKEKELNIAIEGGSAGGKTTLSCLLSTVYDCNVIHMDDFFLRPEQRTPQRFAEIGGNIDRERFLAEVLEPLKEGKEFSYQKFDCSTMSLGEWERVSKKPLTIIEGAYSMHPAFSDYYDFSVFLAVSTSLQKQRIEKRNPGKMALRFFNEWIPLERTYFEKTKTEERCDLVIQIDKN